MIYQDKKIAFATKHSKETVVAPFVESYLGAEIVVPDTDTDLLGTFSGETERPGSALEVVERKARLGIEATKLLHGLASEGSFGPHPQIPLIPCNRETLFFIDNERGFTLHETLLAETTNFSQFTVRDLNEASSFLERTLFPSHGIIVRPNKWDDKKLIWKGITDAKTLQDAFTKSLASSSDSLVWLETDMRAHLNPTRMKVIGDLAERLVVRLATPCPECSAPGWGCVRVERGLPCEGCGLPSEMVTHRVFGCVTCSFKEFKDRDDGLTQASQMYCQFCNP